MCYSVNNQMNKMSNKEYKLIVGVHKNETGTKMVEGWAKVLP